MVWRAATALENKPPRSRRRHRRGDLCTAAGRGWGVRLDLDSTSRGLESGTTCEWSRRAAGARTTSVSVRLTPAKRSPAVCVLARGTDEGTVTRIAHLFTIATNRPIAFPLYSSTIRSEHAGDLVTLGPEDIHEHAPLVTVLRYGRKSRTVDLPVRLSVAFTEVGTLELWCESQVSDHRWRLQFQLRGAAAEGPAGASAYDEGSAGEESGEAEVVVSEEAVAAGEQAIRSVFEGSGAEVTSENLVAHLEQFGYA